MFSKFLGKGDKPAVPTSKDGVSLRGLEVTEDDPDTVWSMWDEALAEQDSKFSALDPAGEPVTPPSANVGKAAVTKPVDALAEATEQTTLESKTQELRKNQALKIVELHHLRIANTIRTLWGDKECGAYINRLIMSGGDGMGKARIGFNQDAVAAMMVLSDLHEGQFGSADAGRASGDFMHSGFTGLDKFR